MFPWREALHYLCAPLTVYRVRALPPLDRQGDSDDDFANRIRQAIADALQIETTEVKWEELIRRNPAPRRGVPPELMRLARQVKEVLPRVPMRDIMRDLSSTRSVDVTITNFLEGVTPYTPEPEVTPEPMPSTSSSQPRYVIPVPTGVFPKSAKERQVSFQERKAQMIEEARKKYIEKHGLNIALNNC